MLSVQSSKDYAQLSVRSVGRLTILISIPTIFFFFFVVQGSLSRSKKKGKHEVLSIINKLLHETKVQKVDFIQSNRSSF